MKQLLQFIASVIIAGMFTWLASSFAWDLGYWSGTRNAQWNCYHNRKTCEWAKDHPPLTTAP